MKTQAATATKTFDVWAISTEGFHTAYDAMNNLHPYYRESHINAACADLNISREQWDHWACQVECDRMESRVAAFYDR